MNHPVWGQLTYRYNLGDCKVYESSCGNWLAFESGDGDPIAVTSSNFGGSIQNNLVHCINQYRS